MAESNSTSESESRIEQAVAEGGAYEVIRKRLLDHGKQLSELTQNLNQQRQEEFGSTEMQVLSRLRLRTEHNCEARDLVLVGDLVLFGYNVFLGLKKETLVEDVFSVYRLKEKEDGYDLDPVNLKSTFLSDQQFVGDFRELYTYYKDTALSQLVVKNNKLLASFQIGERITDVRVFRWNISDDGKSIQYIDNRGERDIELPASHDFEWIECQREDVINGRHPHINILDTIFVDTLGSDLTVKIENNTNSGKGIYSEPVDDSTQSLDDAEFLYSEVGSLILLRIRPYQEEIWRYLVFNKNTEQVIRIDAIGDSCVQLPEDHGLMFPGGYYLTTGEFKSFDHEYTNLKFKRTMRSPNGEDVLYVFYQPDSNIVGLYAYNLINKSLQNPLFGHGYGFYPDGRLLIFYAQDEATRIHPLQIWQTPFFSDEFASSQPESVSFFGKIGNAELVRGISELFSISRLIKSEDASVVHYNDLAKRSVKIFDSYHWLTASEMTDIESCLKQISKTSELVIDEYEKVENIQKQSAKALREAIVEQETLVRDLESENWHNAQDFVEALSRLNHQRGHLLTIRELRYIDRKKIDELESELIEKEEQLNDRTVDFLASPDALSSYEDDIRHIHQEREQCKTSSELSPLMESVDKMANSLDLLSELMASLKVPDATLQTQIIESISSIYSKLNQLKAKLQHQKQSFGSEEATAQFAAQFKLLSQSVQNALGLAKTPEKCDEQLSRLMVQLEELEGQFSEYDDFLADILSKREEIFETFESHKQSLIDARQRKAQTLFDAATRIIQSISRRAQRISEQDELNSFFASDGLVRKLQQLTQQLRELEDSVKADDLESQLKSAKENAIRALRDKSDIYEEGGKIIKLGTKHKFSVNTQELDITLLPRNERMYVHLSGTDYYEELIDSPLNNYRDFWKMNLPSESEDVYRGEYLAFAILDSARSNSDGFDWQKLSQATANEEELLALIKNYIAPRYKEGYEKGIHDHDAAKLLQKLVPNFEAAGSLKFTPLSRAIATLYWSEFQRDAQHNSWHQRAQNALKMRALFSDNSYFSQLKLDIKSKLIDYVKLNSLDISHHALDRASEYLIEELGQKPVQFAISKYAEQLKKSFQLYLESEGAWQDFLAALHELEGHSGKRWYLASHWISGFVHHKEPELKNYIPEAVCLIIVDQALDRHLHQVDLQFKISDLLGQHSKLEDQNLTINLDVFLESMTRHHYQVIPKYFEYQKIRHTEIERLKEELRVDDFIAKPLTSFVRNKLINDVYLPIIGDNLAKQMGTLGDSKRTDLMGLLLMISPPGYGKTTLMEYVADRLGLIFMKINCPAIGHDITSIDPAQATNSASRQELEKLNLALEMGNNVMLYLDDIQHTNPEFLQKFISLCDGTRRIEGVWKGQSKTYDMRGSKFCVVMAGNPYTESGELFKIPDMLANRADIYNLGDMLSGQEDVFELSYIENSLTSNRVLAPLATREMGDVYKFIDIAKGGSTATTDLSYQYSGAEVNEITDILKKMFTIQKIVSRINQNYISSSAQDDRYRTEPPFKLQGSYRNMNKMAEKVSSVMTDDELLQLISDHYQGEAQLLTTGAEENLLKLAELRGNMTTKQETRWEEIKQNFQRNQSMGGDDSDSGKKIVLQLNDLVKQVEKLGKRTTAEDKIDSTTPAIEKICYQLAKLSDSWQENRPNIEVINQPVPGIDQLLKTIAETFENTLLPLVRVMDGKLDLDLKTHKKMSEIEAKLRSITNKSS
ncbi:DNA repair ATPase [Pleionea sediminis]|uniref:DNA repair ATPase n=1 Tax=Pleionea sediminis TaxID=2569479 RepID=UPI001185C7A1|nr:DNA repair ATPase [Pleionea sediminis]